MSNPHITQPEQGFTLIEAMIVMTLLTVFLTILTTLFTSILSLQEQSASYSAVATDGQFIMARLDYDITRASAITTPLALGSSDPSLVMTVGGATYTYVLSGTDLQLDDGTNIANVNGNRTTISDVSFQRLGNSGGKEAIRYSLTVTSTIAHGGVKDVQTFASTAERRT